MGIDPNFPLVSTGLNFSVEKLCKHLQFNSMKLLLLCVWAV